MVERNPIIIPEPSKSRGIQCPRCTSPNYTARNAHGVAELKCNMCGQKWQGGLPQLPQDPREPRPPEPPKPGGITFTASRNRDGDVVDVQEIRQKVDLTQEFRKGAPIEDDEEI
jgi:hypothetical protein